MKQLLLTLLLVLLASTLTCNARIMRLWSYDDLWGKADLVAIAQLKTTKDTSEHTSIEKSQYNSITPFEAIGVETIFTTLAILKGKLEEPTFTFHHYRRATSEKLGLSGAYLVNFNEKADVTYLLFLIKESDGRYAPVSGQIDPSFSVKQIKPFDDTPIVGDIPLR